MILALAETGSALSAAASAVRTAADSAAEPIVQLHAYGPFAFGAMVLIVVWRVIIAPQLRQQQASMEVVSSIVESGRAAAEMSRQASDNAAKAAANNELSTRSAIKTVELAQHIIDVTSKRVEEQIAAIGRLMELSDARIKGKE